MKKIRIVLIVLLMSTFTLTSCESYFDVELDNQANIEGIFSKRKTVRNYLSHIYSYIPIEEEQVYMGGWVTARSDESRFGWPGESYQLFKTGNYSPATSQFNFWSKLYTGISQCSIFMNYIHLDKEDNPKTIAYMKAEARFLRAYYYYCLFRQYGPVFIWGDRLSDETILGATIDRHTVEENIKFIVDELDIAAVDLPLRVGDLGESEDSYMGRATKGAALALKARVLLYAASPLYNGCDLYKGQMKNMYGNFLFPQTPDPEKWEAAAKAALDVIQLGQYDLCKNTKTGDKFKDGAASYQAVMFESWNTETIWGWWFHLTTDWQGTVGSRLARDLPAGFGFGSFGYAGTTPSLKLVDTYPMWETGRYPVKEYKGKNDLSQPVIDEKSGYKAEGWTSGYTVPVDANGAAPFKAHNSCVGRDPRFYACLVPNGFPWPNVGLRRRVEQGAYKKGYYFTCYNDANCTSPRNGVGASISYVGYAWRRLCDYNTSMETDADIKNIKYVYPTFRLAEVYLNYAEACNEKPQRDETAALLYLNKVRNRVGLNDIEVAYPEIKGNKDLLRWCIQKERMVEFGLESMRHYDACRWMIAKDEYPMANWTLHLESTTYEDSYKRVSNEYPATPATFSDKDYLFPINSSQQAEMVNMTQNYGH